MNFNAVENLLNQKWFINQDALLASAIATAMNLMLGEKKMPQRPNCITLLDVYNQDGQKVKMETDGIPEGSVAVINLKGTILRNGTWNYWGANEIVSLLTLVENNKNFIGTVLKVNSRGGAANAIPLFQEFFETKTKPIVSLCEQACSLAYWVPSMTDHIMSADDLTATFGSIGVMTHFADWEGMLKKYGVTFHNIRPDESHDKNEAVLQALAGEYELIKTEHLSPLAKKFQAAVKNNRPNLKAEADGVLSGKTFYYEDSVTNGLCDSLGNLGEALQLVQVLSELK